MRASFALVAKTTASRQGAALLICMAAFFLAVHDAMARHLIAALPVVMLIWVRYFLQAVLMSAWGWARSGPAVFSTRHRGLHFIRAQCLVALSVCFIVGLKYVPLAEATALNFLSPLFVLVISRFVLGESVAPSQWAAVAAGLVGVLMIVRPGGELFVPAALLPCSAALFLSIYQLVTRAASRFDSPATSTIWLGIFAFLIASFALPLFWVTPTLGDLSWMLAMGLAGTFAHWLLASAYQSASPSFLAPFSYIQIVFSIFLGFVLYSTFPSVVAVGGVLLIATSGLIAIKR
jgi:drug/metabolite transporter (DMT)-like permease